jgi:hypothetical protein
MSTLRERFATAVTESAGLTDRELTDRMLGASVGQQAVNHGQSCCSVQNREVLLAALREVAAALN